MAVRPPGANAPPETTATAPTEPVPPRVPPLATFTAEFGMVASTNRRPSLTVIGRDALLVPVSVQSALPIFSRRSKSR